MNSTKKKKKKLFVVGGRGYVSRPCKTQKEHTEESSARHERRASLKTIVSKNVIKPAGSSVVLLRLRNPAISHTITVVVRMIRLRAHYKYINTYSSKCRTAQKQTNRHTHQKLTKHAHHTHKSRPETRAISNPIQPRFSRPPPRRAAPCRAASCVGPTKPLTVPRRKT